MKEGWFARWGMKQGLALQKESRAFALLVLPLVPDKNFSFSVEIEPRLRGLLFQFASIERIPLCGGSKFFILHSSLGFAASLVEEFFI